MVKELVREAEAIRKLADICSGLTGEKACAALAAACSLLGHYDYTEQFARLARQWRGRAPDDAR